MWCNLWRGNGLTGSYDFFLGLAPMVFFFFKYWTQRLLQSIKTTLEIALVCIAIAIVHSDRPIIDINVIPGNNFIEIKYCWTKFPNKIILHIYVIHKNIHDSVEMCGEVRLLRQYSWISSVNGALFINEVTFEERWEVASI